MVPQTHHAFPERQSVKSEVHWVTRITVRYWIFGTYTEQTMLRMVRSFRKGFTRGYFTINVTSHFSRNILPGVTSSFKPNPTESFPYGLRKDVVNILEIARCTRHFDSSPPPIRRQNVLIKCSVFVLYQSLWDKTLTWRGKSLRRD